MLIVFAWFVILYILLVLYKKKLKTAISSVLIIIFFYLRWLRFLSRALVGVNLEYEIGKVHICSCISEMTDAIAPALTSLGETRKVCSDNKKWCRGVQTRAKAIEQQQQQRLPRTYEIIAIVNRKTAGCNTRKVVTAWGDFCLRLKYQQNLTIYPLWRVIRWEQPACVCAVGLG